MSDEYWVKKIIQRYAKNLNPRLANIEKMNNLRFKCIDNCFDCCKYNLVFVPQKTIQQRVPEKIRDFIVWDKKVIRRNKDGYCSLLNEKKCSLNGSKPLVCSAHPFYMDPLDDHVYINLKCPGINQGEKVSKNYMQEIINNAKKFWKLMNLRVSDRILIHENFFLKKVEGPLK